MRKRNVPLYQKLANQLIEAIAAGRYRVGTNVPTEHELCARWHISRSTAIAALNQLEDLGLVARRPRHGTKVISRYPTRSFVKAGGVLQDWAGYGNDYYFETAKIGRAELPAWVKGPGIGKRKGWLHVSGPRRHSRTGKVLGHSELFVRPEYAGVKADLTRRPPLLFTLIEARYGPLVRLIQQDVRATILPAEIASAFGVKDGSPGLEIRRSYFGPSGKLIEVVTDLHPGSSFAYRTEVRRGADT